MDIKIQKHGLRFLLREVVLECPECKTKSIKQTTEIRKFKDKYHAEFKCISCGCEFKIYSKQKSELP